MPFTVSHIAAILPFSGKRRPFSALAIGAMSPDFEYLLRLKAQTTISHTPPGILSFCVPAGLLALWPFHRVLKLPMAALLPDPLQARCTPLLVPFPIFPPARLALMALCIAFGAATHIVWDSFTHRGGWFVHHLPTLQRTTFETPYGSPQVCRMLQHGSTALGMIVLLYAFCLWFPRANVHAFVARSFPSASRRMGDPASGG